MTSGSRMVSTVSRSLTDPLGLLGWRWVVVAVDLRLHSDELGELKMMLMSASVTISLFDLLHTHC